MAHGSIKSGTITYTAPTRWGGVGPQYPGRSPYRAADKVPAIPQPDPYGGLGEALSTAHCIDNPMSSGC
jgi:hypothetical protein